MRVVIVTNSLASNNHVSVHGAYARYRHPIICAGVELCELRVDATEAPRDKDEVESVTLHTKAMMIDRRYTFIGSLNLDPRSIDINTELGVLVDSTEMANSLSQRFFAALPGTTYQVVENEDGRLRWQGLVDGKQVVEKGEPQAAPEGILFQDSSGKPNLSGTRFDAARRRTTDPEDAVEYADISAPAGQALPSGVLATK